MFLNPSSQCNRQSWSILVFVDNNDIGVLNDGKKHIDENESYKHHEDSEEERCKVLVAFSFHDVVLKVAQKHVEASKRRFGESTKVLQLRAEHHVASRNKREENDTEKDQESRQIGRRFLQSLPHHRHSRIHI